MDREPPSDLILRCASPEDTRRLAARLAPALAGGEWLLLRGPLGAGKTTFVRGLAAALGWEGTVRSPTFNLVAAYPTRPRLIHVDLYRLEQPAAVEDLGIDDLAGEEPAVVAVEWPDLLTDPPSREPVLRIDIEPSGDLRLITLHPLTPPAARLLEAVREG